jgi:hypothetical protein
MSWGSQHLRYFNGNKIPIRAIQDFDHAMIHLGKGFTHSSRHNGIAGAATLDHYLVCGNATHLRNLEIEADGAPVSVVVYENPTVSANGTAEVIQNNNRYRVTENPSGNTLYHSPTVTDVGTELGQVFVPSAGGNSGGVGLLAGGEFLLKGGSTYLFRFTNEDNNATDMHLLLFWYEPNNGEN